MRLEKTLFTPIAEICPDFAGFAGAYRNNIGVNAYVKDGSYLYLMGSTILQKYDISDIHTPKLLCQTDVNADHLPDAPNDFLSGKHAHATALINGGQYLFIGIRGGGGGVSNMDDGVLVGNLAVVDKTTLKKVKEITFENRVTGITRHRDYLIVSLHFHGFYIYRLNDCDILRLVATHIETEKPRRANTREFQNSVVVSADDTHIKMAFACYLFGIGVYDFNTKSASLTFSGGLNQNLFPHMSTPSPHSTGHTVYGIAGHAGWVYGGVSTGHNRFREAYQTVDWNVFDHRGVLYGPADKTTGEQYLMELPNEDKPTYTGMLGGDPAPAYLCVAEPYLLFNLDKEGIGVAEIQKDGKLTYLGRTLEDAEGRALSHNLQFDGQWLYAAYRHPLGEENIPPVFRIFAPVKQ